MRLAEQEDKHAARWAERIAAATGRDARSQGGRARAVLVPAHLRSERRAAPARAGREQGRSRVRPADGAAERSRPTGKIAEEAMLEERDHAVVLRTLAGGTDADAALDARHDPRPRAMARARHRLDRRRHLRRQRRPRRRLRHRLGHGRIHRRQRGRAGGGPGRHAGQRAVDGRRRLSGVEVASARSTSRRSRASSTEIEEDPHEELLELELFYQLKGFSAEEARSMAERLQKEPKQFLRTLVHEELGLSEENFPEPVALDAVGHASRPRSAASSRSSRSSSRSACRR